MLKVGTRAIIRIEGSQIQARTISVKADTGSHFNRLEYGNSSLSNDFDNTILLVAALEDAKSPADVLTAAKRYYRFRNQVGNIKLVTDY